MPIREPTAVIEQLWQTSPLERDAEVYAILDGARNERIYPGVTESGEPYCCLYRGELEPGLAEAAPYLVQLQRDAAFTSWLITQGWGDSWGIFLKSASTLSELRRHFRRFLMVYDSDRKPLYFRYYDPRVMRVYLPTCTADELQVVFGPVGKYLMEDKDAKVLLEYGCSHGKLMARKVALGVSQRWIDGERRAGGG